MKIGINSRLYQDSYTGIPNYIENLFTSILKIDKKNSYTFFQTQRKKMLGNTKLFNIKDSMLGAILFDNIFVSLMIRKEKMDIFHGPAHILPFFKDKGVKYVVTIHDLAFLIFPEQYPFLFRTYYKFAVKHSLSVADAVVSVSENTRQDIIKYYKVHDKKIRVLYPGIPSNRIESVKTKRIIKERYFLSVTTHPKRKNILNVLDALKALSNKIDLNYVIVGMISPSQREELEMKISNLDLHSRVIIYGYASDEDLKNIYANADFLVYPSFYEGFGFPVLEAVVNRCLVITSNNSSLVELLPNSDWLINPYDIQDISNKILYAANLNTAQREIIINQNISYAKKFSWDNTSNQLITMYEELVK